MNAEEARARLLLAQKRIQLELQELASDLGPDWEIDGTTEWTDMSTLQGLERVPTVMLWARLWATR